MHISKGKADVDEKFGTRSLWKVYEDASGNQYTAYLNKADLLDNNNKFYVLQLLQQVHNPNSYGIFTRYGRVGTPGVQEMKQMDSKDEKDEEMNLTLAIKEYDKIFKQKTSKAKGYSALEMRSGGDEKETTEAVDPTDSALEMEPSKLEPAVQSLMEFIHDKKAMEKLVIKAGYDVSKLPIGKLSEETILEGYKYLS
jgi:poly [ADP-ribose] polymerase 2/3/4